MEETISFEDLGLDEQTLAAIARKGFETPSPIQVLAIPRLLNGDANVIARARTGTGKTAAFGLPLVQKLRDGGNNVRALILEPTRELAVQTCREMQSFTEARHPNTCVVYGGASMGEQIRELRRGADIVAGTPGRVKDLIDRGVLDISKIEYFILDEGDEMLDMGFIDDIEEIFSQANENCRILLFSATMPAPILKIAQKFMGEYEIVEEEGVLEEPLLIEQKYWVLREGDKIEALVRLIDSNPDFFGLVFTQTKNDADTVSRRLDEKGYDVAALHGDIPQGQREKILARFRSRKTRVLVATDVAARGIDINGLSHVVNYSLPFDASTYVHRIGRTGRAGSTGCAVTFVRPEERRKLNFLKNAVAKASKGDLNEAAIPSIDSVLAIKRGNLFDEMKISLGLKRHPAEIAAMEEEAAKKAKAAKAEAESAVVTTDDEIIPIEGEAVAENQIPENTEFAANPGTDVVEETAVEDTAAAAVPADDDLKLISAPSVFVDMAKELCEKNEPEQVLAAVLSVMYGKSLDRSRYGKIEAVGGDRKGGRRERDGRDSASRADQIRLYIQLGRRDGYNPKGIAEYFSDLLHIPGRMVDRIDVSTNFSLVSLPVSDGNRVLEMSKRDSTIPHIHIDSKSESGSRSGRGRGGDFGGRRDGGRRGDRDRGHFGGRRDGFKNNHGRVNPHTSVERSGSASFFKKKNNSKEF